jgi:thioredoxin-like negative regulator of GroEL
MKAFREGRVVGEFVGATPPAAVARFLDELRVMHELPGVVAALEQDLY